jgi:hypothetical protein
MKKPLRLEPQQPRIIERADLPPLAGYALVVDGRFKTAFAEQHVAEKSGRELLANYPMLKIEIYDASSKIRTSLK